MCSCQVYGKREVPNARGTCLVCGERVEPGSTRIPNPDDNDRLAALHESIADPASFARLMHDYYRDADRADRTPRALLYLHLGMLIGMLDRSLDRSATPMINDPIDWSAVAAGFGGQFAQDDDHRTHGFAPAVAAEPVVAAEEAPSSCPVFRPDHNGECILCDEWMDAHTPDAIAAGEQLAALLQAGGDYEVDRCQVCNRFLGIGLRALHLGICEDCRAAKENANR